MVRTKCEETESKDEMEKHWVRLGYVKLLDLLESWKVMDLIVTVEKKAKCR